MAFIVKPAADSGLKNATLHAEGAFPLRIEGLAPGSYSVGRVSWAPEPVLVLPTATLPGVPRNLSLREVGPDRVTVAWEPPESDGGAPVISYQVAARLAGSPTHLPWLAGDSPQTFMDLEPETAYEFRVRARNSVGLGEWTPGWTKQVTAAMATQDKPDDAPRVAGEAVGYLAFRDEGVTGDWFVAPDGSDAAAGTLAAPFATIGKAMSVASGGDVIRVRGGTYREHIDFTGKGGSAGARTTVARYGAEQVVVSGFEVLSGWTACGADDEAVVGPNYASLYKATIPTSSLPPGGGRIANLYEGTTKLNLAALKVPFPFRPNTDLYAGDWVTADSIGLTGGKISSYTLAGLSDKYSEAQIVNAIARMFVYPNADTESAISSFDDGTDTITITDQTQTPEAGDLSKRFCLINLLPAMKPGQWGYVTEGANTTFYLWPLDTASLTGGILYSAREQSCDFNAENHCEIRGLIFEGASAFNSSGVSPMSIHGKASNEGLVVENCLSRNIFVTHHGVVISLSNGGANNRIENYGIDNAPGCYGIFRVGSNSVVDKCLIRGTSHSPIRIYGGHDTRITRNLCIDCGEAAHANKGNVYLGGYSYLWWHNIWHGCDGYFTWQEASSIHLGFSSVPAGNSSGRAIVDQNRDGGYSHATTTEVVEVSYIVNNASAPRADGFGANGMTLGRVYEPYVFYGVHNNLLLTHTVLGDYIDSWSNNLYVAETKRDPSDTLIDPDAVWENRAIGDISIKATSPSLSAASADLTGIVAALQSAGFNYDGFGLDLAGQPFDLEEPPVGPYLPGSTPVALPPVWLQQPVINGTPEPGQVLTVGGGELVGYPYPTRTYQWIRSDDDFVTHSSITGATAAAYEVSEGDIGSKLGCIVTAGGEAVTTPIVNAEVGNSYPISTPRVLTTKLFAGTAANKLLKTETDSFRSDGSALLVVVGIRNNVGSADDYAVTVGTPGRKSGSGARLVDVGGYVHRWGVYGHAFFIARPPEGEVTVQVEGTRAEVSTAQVVVLSVAGAGAAAFDGKIGGTNVTGLSASLTSQADNGYLIWMLVRVGGSGASAVGVDYGGSVLFDAGTSVSGDYGMWLSLFGEAAPQKGKKSAKTTFSTASASMGGIALAPE